MRGYIEITATFQSKYGSKKRTVMLDSVTVDSRSTLYKEIEKLESAEEIVIEQSKSVRSLMKAIVNDPRNQPIEKDRNNVAIEAIENEIFNKR